MLRQWEGILAPEVSTADATGQDVWTAIRGQVSQFVADYQAWQSGGRDGLANTAAELQSLRVQLGGEWDRLRAAGDTVGAEAVAATVAEVDAAREAVRGAQEQADQWGGTWDTLYAWLTAAGATVGLGIVFIPIALSAAAAVAAIAALAYVLRTWRDNADRAAYLRDLTSRVARGELSSGDAAALATSYTPPSESFLGGILGQGPTSLLVLGGIGLAAVLVMRR